MIVESIVIALVQLLTFVLSLFPSFDAIVIPSDLFNAFDYIFELCAWFIPSDVFSIFAFWVAICNYHFLYSVTVRIWDALPFT